MIVRVFPGFMSTVAVFSMVFSGCASFTETKTETLPDGTVRHYEEPVPFWVQAASVAKVILTGDATPPDQTVQFTKSSN
jgi:hypothetical protein